jgi:hypothetical protein
LQYGQRTYRQLFRQDDLVYFRVVVRQTDLHVGVRRERFSPELAYWLEDLVQKQRIFLEDYIKKDPEFINALSSYKLKSGAPPIVVDMAAAAVKAGVGPMAAVAGAFAEYAGTALSRRSRDVIVENGGDIYLRSTKRRRIGIFAGQSPLSNRMALEILPEDTPLGICTSSGTVGPSLSFGRADAAVVLSPSVSLADAVATAAANLIQNEKDIPQAVQYATEVNGVKGALVIKGDRLAVRGDLKLVPMLS